MSIQDRLEELGPQKFARLQPIQPSSKMLRTVYASQEVRAFLATPKSAFTKTSGQALAMLDAFANNDETTFRMNPQSRVSTVWARNDPLKLGICDLRVLAPEPSVRIFGAFCSADTFVALTWQKRKLLDFGIATRRARGQWDLHFRGFDPIISEDVHDYISNAVTAF